MHSRRSPTPPAAGSPSSPAPRPAGPPADLGHPHGHRPGRRRRHVVLPPPRRQLLAEGGPALWSRVLTVPTPMPRTAAHLPVGHPHQVEQDDRGPLPGRPASPPRRTRRAASAASARSAGSSGTGSGPARPPVSAASDHASRAWSRRHRRHIEPDPAQPGPEPLGPFQPVQRDHRDQHRLLRRVLGQPQSPSTRRHTPTTIGRCLATSSTNAPRPPPGPALPASRRPSPGSRADPGQGYPGAGSRVPGSWRRKPSCSGRSAVGRKTTRRTCS